jgi:hypothetical protein
MVPLDRLNPPWGPARDPHFEPTHNQEGRGRHEQVTAEEAILKGWFTRVEWYTRLVPDTRRCRFHGEIMYQPLDLTKEQVDVLYRFQDSGQATGPIAGGTAP